jgi:hypothetical protein
MCSNYRPITLLNMRIHSYSEQQTDRLSKLVESKLSEAQVLFRSNGSTLDNTSYVKHLKNAMNIM